MSIIARAKSVKGSLAGAIYKENELKGGVVIIKENLVGKNAQEKWEEMKTLAKLNKKTAKPFLENVLSPSGEVGKRLTPMEWRQLAKDYAHKMGFEKNQWYAVLHTNTDEHHLHIFANRIGFDGKNNINDYMIGKKAGEVADKLAQERGLKTAKEVAQEKVSVIAQVIREQSRGSVSWEDFVTKMKNQGYYFNLNYNKKGLNGARVIPIEDLSANPSKKEQLAKKGYTLSKIDRKLKVGEMEKLFQQNKLTAEIEEKQEKRKGMRI